MTYKMVVWTDELSVGVERIDNQHKKLFEVINTFYEHLEAGKTSALEDLLSSLSDYAAFHFECEEGYFDAAGHPEAEQHKKAHRGFIAKISGIQARIRRGEMVLSLEVTEFLRSWLLNHIKYEDPKYRKYLEAVGIE